MNALSVEYYEWLVSQIAVPRNNKRYYGLFERMHNLEFVWTVNGDRNRVQDAMDLRIEFAGSQKARAMRPEYISILEVVIALSRRIAFTSLKSADSYLWAWRLIKNLGLNRMSDVLRDIQADRIDEVLYSLVWRTYEPDGRGGFFPLRNPKEDQTKVEVWDQMNAYLVETEF